MTNFEKITESESALVDWLRGTITCRKCPVLKKCSCSDKPCQRLLYEWLKRDDREEKWDDGRDRFESEIIEAIDDIDWYHQNASKEMVSGASNEHEAWYRAEDVYRALESVPSAQPEQRWIPIKWHDCTDEDREKYGFSNDIVAVFDCEMPDDDQPILVTTSHGYVNQDVCYIDDGYSLDSGWDWIDDIKAWMPLPEPYKGESEDTE